ncbi:MAG: hypothetical protein K1X28_02315 [Parachlamydiales bacterium]|nr:hypothetical protein [Parachlamydiales bacterium]
MTKKSQGPKLGAFYTELLELLSRNCEKQFAESGVNPKLKELWEDLPQNSQWPLHEIIERYQHLFVEKEPVHLEKTLLEAFPPKDFIELGLTRTYPRVYRGLPRFYLKDHPSTSQIKPNFSGLPSLKRQAAARAIFSLYSKVPARGKVTLFTWVMNDGQGDFIAGGEVYRLLKARLPDVELRFIAFVPEDFQLPMIENAILIPYQNDCPISLIPEEGLRCLRDSDLILQLPTYYPETAQLKQALEKMQSDQPMPKFEFVGEYGFVESSRFHPKSGNYSLGLHFLEKGILTRRPCLAGWEDVQNEHLKFWRVKENRFYLAYLTSPVGGAIYLHSLLKSLENDPADIDLCVPDIGWFIGFYEKQQKEGKSILVWDLGVSTIEVYFQDQRHVVTIQPHGKKLRLLCPGSISQSDFRALLSLSGEWVAVRGNQSFSEAISQGKAFFYDGRDHARNFIKDFAAIAENRIGEFRGTLDCIRGMVQGFLYNIPVQDDIWVDETYFQELEDWPSVALKIGLALQDSDTVAGFRAISKILVEEFSAAPFLCHLVQRALCHRHHSYLEQLEEEQVLRFIKNEQSFKSLILAQRKFIASCQKNSSVG